MYWFVKLNRSMIKSKAISIKWRWHVSGNKDRHDQARETEGQGAGSDVMSERKCARPTAPRQGRMRVRERGKLVYFRCRRRFQMYGSARAVCINQTWSHPPPVCVGRITCAHTHTHTSLHLPSSAAYMYIPNYNSFLICIITTDVTPCKKLHMGAVISN